MRTSWFVACLLALLAGTAQAQEPRKPQLPGIGGVDNRSRVDPASMPWRALGRLQANAGNLHMSCTGALVAPATILTAAHCLYNERTQTFFRPAELHFLLGYAQGSFVAHALGLHTVIGAGFDPKRPHEAEASDWALVTLDQKLGTPDRILAFDATAQAAGQGIMLGGYSQDFVEVLTADKSCRLIGAVKDSGGHAMLWHDCAATRGASGAPLLVHEAQGWRIIGVEIGAYRDAVGGVAALTSDAAHALAH